MPHPAFRRVVGPDPNNGIRGDKVRPALFNDIYDALENTPTLDDLLTPVNLQGVLTSTGDLPTGGNTLGDAYLVNGVVWVWDGSAWSNQGSLTQGEAGTPASLTLKGTVTTVGDLPDAGNVVNDVWVVEADGHGWAWTADHEWVDIGTIQGPAGAAGPDTDLRTRVDPVTVGDYRTALSWDDSGTPAKAGIAVSPLLFGAVGDGATDDSAALNDYIAGLDLIATTTVKSGRGIILDGHNRTYAVSEPFVISDVWFLTMRNFRFVVTAPIADVLLLKGVSFSSFENIHISADGSYAGGNTADYGVRLESNQGVTTPAAVSTHNVFTNVTVLDIKTKTGFGIGVNSGSNQVDDSRFYGCYVNGLYDVDSPDATWYQYGFRFGSGTSANILLNFTYGCTTVAFKYPVSVNATDLYWFGGQVQGGDAGFFHAGNHTLHAEGFRSEGSGRLFESNGAGNTVANITFKSVTFDCDQLNADGHWVYFKHLGHVTLENINLNLAGSGVNPDVNLSNATASKKFLHIRGMRSPTTIQTCYSHGGTLYGKIEDYTEINPADGTYVEGWGTVLIAETPIHALVGTNAPDVSIYRNTAQSSWYAPGAIMSGNRFELHNTGSAFESGFITYAPTGAHGRFEALINGTLSWGVGTSARDTEMGRTAADMLKMSAGDNFGLVSGYIEGGEIADPAAPAANTGRLYIRDNGSGKTQLVVRFPTGAIQVIATEP